MIYTRPALMIHGDAPMNIMSEDVLQIYPDTCAIKSQQLILEYFGIHFTEDQLRNEAMMYGWYNGGRQKMLANCLSCMAYPFLKRKCKHIQSRK